MYTETAAEHHQRQAEDGDGVRVPERGTDQAVHGSASDVPGKWGGIGRYADGACRAGRVEAAGSAGRRGRRGAQQRGQSERGTGDLFFEVQSVEPRAERDAQRPARRGVAGAGSGSRGGRRPPIRGRAVRIAGVVIRSGRWPARSRPGRRTGGSTGGLGASGRAAIGAATTRRTSRAIRSLAIATVRTHARCPSPEVNRHAADHRLTLGRRSREPEYRPARGPRSRRHRPPVAIDLRDWCNSDARIGHRRRISRSSEEELEPEPEQVGSGW